MITLALTMQLLSPAEANDSPVVNIDRLIATAEAFEQFKNVDCKSYRRKVLGS